MNKLSDHTKNKLDCINFNKNCDKHIDDLEKELKVTQNQDRIEEILNELEKINLDKELRQKSYFLEKPFRIQKYNTPIKIDQFVRIIHGRKELPRTT